MCTEMSAKCEQLITKLQWMKEKKIWPNGLRYLWTDAHGVCALLTLYHELKVSRKLVVQLYRNTAGALVDLTWWDYVGNFKYIYWY